MSWILFHWNRSLNILASLLPLLWLGCSSTPPAPVPAARSQASFLADTAAKLSQSGNWPGAVSQWTRAAQQYSALNDLCGQALALHHLALAQKELWLFKEANSNLLMAASLNVDAGSNSAWWMNQIAMLQVQRSEQTLLRIPAQANNALSRGVNLLMSRTNQCPSQEIRALFYNEAALYNMGLQHWTEASTWLGCAHSEFTQLKSAEGVAAVKVNEALLHLALARHDQALNCWSNALTLYETLADMPGIARSLEGLAQTWIAANTNLDLAAKAASRSAANQATLHNIFGQAQALALVVQCQHMQGQDTSESTVQWAQALAALADKLERAGHFSAARQYWIDAESRWRAVGKADCADVAQCAAQRCAKLAASPTSSGQ